MGRNLAALLALLAGGARVHYFDHHVSGPVPQHERLTVHIDTAADLCTSLLMDRHLGGRQRAWALVGAYGDDLVVPADRLARAIDLGDSQRAELRRLGQAINYNAYGDDATDTLITPAELYGVMSRHADPFSMLACEPIFDELDMRRRVDLHLALALPPLREGPYGRLVLLPDAAWSRRVSGCLANVLATSDPARASRPDAPARRRLRRQCACTARNTGRRQRAVRALRGQWPRRSGGHRQAATRSTGAVHLRFFGSPLGRTGLKVLRRLNVKGPWWLHAELPCCQEEYPPC